MSNYSVIIVDLCRKQRKIIEVMLQARYDLIISERLLNFCNSAGPRVFANDDVKKFELKFFRSPVKFLPSPNGTVQGVALEINKLEVENIK